jgi:uncharacterized membrane protein required for colicin V production
MNIDVKVIAIICLTVICCFALYKGIDSTLVGTVSAIIGSIAGYEFGRRQRTTERSKE